MRTHREGEVDGSPPRGGCFRQEAGERAVNSLENDSEGKEVVVELCGKVVGAGFGEKRGADGGGQQSTTPAWRAGAIWLLSG
jgi:hypothetical protein